ncbi:MAG: hypothetical protein GX051_04880 [Clostridiales bacterium]|nr:hypothetical protein [Clostridiales bacterium]
MKQHCTRKLVSVLLAVCLILPLAISPLGVSASAADLGTFRYNGLQITPVEGGTAVLNVADKTICGIKTGMTAAQLKAIFTPDTENDVTIIPSNGNLCGNGTLVEVRNSLGALKETFKIIIFGDLNGDSVTDALDSATVELVVSGHVPVEEIPIEAADIDGDGNVSINDFSASSNDAVGNVVIDQKAEEPEVANTGTAPDILAQLFTGNEVAPEIDPTFNGVPLSNDDFDIVYENNTELGTATITITGKGNFTGSITKTFKITGPVENAVCKANDILDKLGINEIAYLNYTDAGNVEAIFDATAALAAQDININSTALTGLLGDLGTYFTSTFADAEEILLGGEAVYVNGEFRNSALKSALYNLCGGAFELLANMGDDNILKTVDVSIVRASGPENFTLSAKLAGLDTDIDKFQSLSATLAAHLAMYQRVNGTTFDTVVELEMPDALMNALIEQFETEAQLKSSFDNLSVSHCFSLFETMTAADVFGSNASKVDRVLKTLCGMEALINKVYSKFSDVTVATVAGDSYDFFADDANFAPEDTDNAFADFAAGFAGMMSDDVSALKTGAFYVGDGYYEVPVTFSVNLGSLGLMQSDVITETVIVRMHLFDAANINDAPSVGAQQIITANTPVTAIGGNGVSLGNSFSAYASGGDLAPATLSWETTALVFTEDAQHKTPVIDFENNIITGFPSELTSLEGLVSAKDGKSLNIINKASYPGTGTRIQVLENSEITEEYTLAILGDLNGDGTVDGIDYATLDLISNNFHIPSVVESAASDTNCDGKVDINDIAPVEQESVEIARIEPPRKIVLNGRTTVSQPSDVTYTGSAFTPGVSVDFSGSALDPANYTVSYSSNINAGTASVTVSGKGDYVGSITKTFNIAKADRAAGALTYINQMLKKTGSALTAAVSKVSNDDFTYTVKYNGSETKPTDVGVYFITADIAESENYNALNDIALGSMIVAPANGTGYTVNVDSASRKISVAISKPNSPNATLLADVLKYYNSAAASLKVGTVDISSGDALKSALDFRALDMYTYSSNTVSIAQSTDNLGSFLVADNALWNDNLAANQKNLSFTSATTPALSASFKIEFLQNSATVESLKESHFMTQAQAVRGQRTTEASPSVWNYAKIVNGEKVMRCAVKDSSATVYNALSGSGLKTLIIGNNKLMWINPSKTNNFSSSTPVSMFDSDNVRISSYSGLSMLSALDVMKSVTKSMGISLPSAFGKISTCVGQSGYGQFRSVDYASSGIRYSDVYKVEFTNYNATQDDHHTATINADAAKGKVTLSGITQADRLSYGEYVVMAPTAVSGYKLDSITVTDASGNIVPVTNNRFVMPASNVTINAVFSAK